MTHRLRMARKRLMVARMRDLAAYDKWVMFGDSDDRNDWFYRSWLRRLAELRAIVYRKDRIA